MNIKKFKYNGKDREVLVIEETSSNIIGIDMSHMSDEIDKEKKEYLRETAENLTIRKDMNGQNFISFNNYDKESQDPYEGRWERFNDFRHYYRNFKKSNIVPFEH